VTKSVGREALTTKPSRLPPFTVARSDEPRSPSTTVYVAEVAFGIGEHSIPGPVHRSHWYEKTSWSPLTAPRVVDSVAPSVADPETTGAATVRGTRPPRIRWTLRLERRSTSRAYTRRPGELTTTIVDRRRSTRRKVIAAWNARPCARTLAARETAPLPKRAVRGRPTTTLFASMPALLAISPASRERNAFVRRSRRSVPKVADASVAFGSTFSPLNAKRTADRPTRVPLRESSRS
jgi:hypothetical protein